MQSTQLPPTVQLMQLITGRWITHMIASAADLGLADHLGQGPRTATELAAAAGATEDGVNRLLRGLTAVGVFEQAAPGTYRNSALSECLREDHPQSCRGMARMVACAGTVQGWLQLTEAVRTGGNAFRKAHGKGVFDYFEAAPEEGVIFHQAMTSFSRSSVPLLLDAYDFSRFREVVDLGGGHGFFLRSLLAACPGPRAVLVDLPEVLATAPQDDAEGRLRQEAGSFFDAVPAGADAYFMKHILHDWSDDHCLRILGHVRRAMDPQGRVLVADQVLPEGPEPHFAKVLDLEMLAMTDGGRERSEEEFRTLFRRAGLDLLKVHPTPGPVSLLEAAVLS